MKTPQSKLKQVAGHFDADLSAEQAIRAQVNAVLDNFTEQLRRDEKGGLCRSIRGVARINFTGGVGGRFILDMRLLPTDEIPTDELAKIVDAHIAEPVAEGTVITQGSVGFVPKIYFDNGRTVEWGENLTETIMAAMDGGEIFTLLDVEGKPHRRLLKDSYGTFREGPINQGSILDDLLGIPPSPFKDFKWIKKS